LIDHNFWYEVTTRGIPPNPGFEFCSGVYGNKLTFLCGQTQFYTLSLG